MVSNLLCMQQSPKVLRSQSKYHPIEYATRGEMMKKVCFLLLASIFGGISQGQVAEWDVPYEPTIMEWVLLDTRSYAHSASLPDKSLRFNVSRKVRYPRGPEEYTEYLKDKLKDKKMEEWPAILKSGQSDVVITVFHDSDVDKETMNKKVEVLKKIIAINFNGCVRRMESTQQPLPKKLQEYCKKTSVNLMNLDRDYIQSLIDNLPFEINVNYVLQKKGSTK